MRFIVDPERNYFMQEDMSEEVREAHASLDRIDKAKRKVIERITAAMDKYIETVNEESCRCGNASDVSDVDLVSMRNMIEDLVGEVGHQQIDAIQAEAER
jgi:hypothetical protein